MCIRDRYYCVQTDLAPLDCDAYRPFCVGNFMYISIRQAHCHIKYHYCTTFNTPPMIGSVQSQASILTEREGKELARMSKDMGESMKFLAEEFSVLQFITEAYLDTYPQHRQILISIASQYIANCTSFDNRLGTGVGPRLARWDKGAYLRGHNLYGKVLMTIASKLKKPIR